MHKPLKGSFTDIINAIADGKGVKPLVRSKAADAKIIRASEPPAKPK
jgi:hypothetical protein